MRTVRDIKVLFRDAGISTHPAADRAVVADALQAGGLTSQIRPAHNKRAIWRFLMESRMTQLAAVFVLAAMLLGVHYFSGTAVKAVEFSEIAKALGEVPWMHTVAIADIPQAKGTIEQWIGFHAKVEGGKMPDGKVSLLRLQEHERAEYDPNSNTITLSYAQESDFSPQMSSPAWIVESMQKALKDHGAQIVTRMGKHRGRKVQVQEISLAKHFRGIDLYTVKLYVDPQSKLLYAMESTAIDANNVAISTAQATYDYPPTGPRDIYDLGVPRDAKVVNNIPANDLRSILERYRQIREDATQAYIAVIAHNTGANYTDAVNQIDVDYKSGRKHRWERHSVFDQGQPFRDPQDPAWAISKQRIGETFESMLAWTQAQLTRPGKTWIDIRLFDGEYEGSVRKDPKDGWGKPRKHYEPDSIGLQDGLGDLAWPEIHTGAQMIEDEYAKEHTLICFERLQQGHLYNGTVSLPGRFLWYLDPTQDYLCRRKVTEWRRDADWQENRDWLKGVDPSEIPESSGSMEEITEAFQAPNGHWYPAAIAVSSAGRDLNQAPLKAHHIKRIYLDLSPVFPEGIFDIDKLPGQ